MGAISVGNGTPTNLATRLWTYDASTTTWSADLKATAAFDYFPDAIGGGDSIYFVHNYPPKYLSFNVGTQLVADAITIVWEYYRYENGGGGYVDITTDVVDNTNSFQNAGVNTVDFTNCKIWNAGQNYTHSVECPITIRCRVTAVTNPTEGGANQTNTVQCENLMVYLTGFASGSPCTFYDIWNYLTATMGYTYCNYEDNDVSDDDNYDAYYFLPIGIFSADDSYIKTQREKVCVGNGSLSSAFQNINLLAGEITSDGITYDGSTIYFTVGRYFFSTQNYLKSGSRIYDSKIGMTPFLNPDTNNWGAGGGYASTQAGAIMQDTHFLGCAFYYHGGTFTNCKIDSGVLLYTVVGTHNGTQFYSVGSTSYWFTCYYNVSAILVNSKIQSVAAGNPTIAWCWHYLTYSPSTLIHIFEDCTPKCPDQDDDPYMYTRSAGKAEGGWYGYETHKIKFTVVNEEGVVLAGVKLSASQKDAVVGTWSDVTFIKSGVSTVTTNSTILTSTASGDFEKAGDGFIYSIRCQQYYYDAVNSAGYPTSDNIVSVDQRLTKFKFQLQGYETQIVTMDIGEDDANSEMILPKGIVTLKRSPYAGRT